MGCVESSRNHKHLGGAGILDLFMHMMASIFSLLHVFKLTHEYLLLNIIPFPYLYFYMNGGDCNKEGKASLLQHVQQPNGNLIKCAKNCK